MSRSYGWAVVEINQASHQPEVLHGPPHPTRYEAEEAMLELRAETANLGRREVFIVVELTEQGGND